MSVKFSGFGELRTGRVFFLLLVLVGLVYSNCLDAIWTLDDDPNILQNSRLHIEDLLPETLFQSFFSPLHPDESGRPGFNRPLAHLSFALNWYFGQDAPAGYRLVNILIHALTAFVLFLVICGLLQAPNLRGAYGGRQDFIALLGAALWAVNPIQTQAVVYIVQRMASLACLFYLLGIWCYLRARACEPRAGRLLWLFLMLASFLAGVGSKENAILLPAALVLLEFVFFQDLSQAGVRRRLGYVLLSGLGLIVLGGVWLFSQGKLEALPGYGIRLFSPAERLLTEPRIVVFYLSQIFYPVPGRLSIVHDVQLSRSLLEPWTTLPAIVAVLGLIGLGVWQARRRPLLSFAILFFFLNHAVESSLIGLELIYEHRNYLPSLFLFVPVAAALQGLIDRYRAQNRGFRHVLAGFVILLTTGLGISAHIRNMAWLEPKTFWEDAARKAPRSMRPIHNLAYEYYEKKGHYQAAFQLYRRELELIGYNRYDLSIAHVNIANHYYRLGDFNQASEHLDQALANFPEFELAQYRQAFVCLRAEDLHRALGTLQPLVARRPGSFDYNHLMAQILLKMGRQEETFSYLRRCLRLAPESAKALGTMGIALNLNGNYERAEWFLGAALDRAPGDKRTLLWLIDCQLRRSDEAAAAASASKFLEGTPLDKIQASISKALDDLFMSAGTQERVSRWVWLQAHHRTSRTLESLRG
jgi:tetratricopeptide (TPR) repeat protein